MLIFFADHEIEVQCLNNQTIVNQVFSVISGDEDDSLPVGVTSIILLGWLVLEELHVGETVEESISGATHNDVFFIGDCCSLQFFVLLIRECLDLEVAHVVIFLTLDQLLVILLECILIA